MLTKARYIHQRLFTGTLARMPLGGGAPREVLEGVREADWAPDGENLAIIREVDGKDRLEYPIGKVLYTSGGYVSDLRVSPKADRIAFLEHPSRWDDRGGVSVVDLTGKKTGLADGYWGEEGLAWSPDGMEVFFSAGQGYSSFDVRAVTLTGRNRVALPSSGGLTLLDISREGRWLAAREDVTWRLMAMAPGANTERDLSWLDGSLSAALSRDGQSLLFSESSGAFGNNYAVCLRKTDGSPVIRLGEGGVGDLSPDGRWALAFVPTSPDRLVLYPTGPGDPRASRAAAFRATARRAGSPTESASSCAAPRPGMPRAATRRTSRAASRGPSRPRELEMGSFPRTARFFSSREAATRTSSTRRPAESLDPFPRSRRTTSWSAGPTTAGASSPIAGPRYPPGSSESTSRPGVGTSFDASLHRISPACSGFKA